MKILLVDDDPEYTSLFKKSWEAKFPEDVFLTANDPVQANLTAIDHRPEAILIDAFMPVQNGLQLLKELRCYEPLQNTKFYVLSGFDENDIVKMTSQVMADGLLSKELGVREVARIIRGQNEGNHP